MSETADLNDSTVTLHSLSALGVTQSVHVMICIRMQQGSDFKFPEYLWQDLWQDYDGDTDRKFLRKPNLNEITTTLDISALRQIGTGL
jgi:hypothetical protein